MHPFQDSFETPPSKNNQCTHKKNKIVINLSETQYSVIRQVAKKLKWNIVNECVNNLNFDICWMDGHVRQELFSKMQNNQKINHFPGKNLMLFRKKFILEYDFFPITWTLPAEYKDLQAYHENRQQGKAQTFIVKPEASCQGRGIFLTRNIDKLKNEKCVVQRYMHKPYLIDGLKFDLRIYVLVTGIDPLRIFVYEEGLARFATETYKPPKSDNLDNRFMHLTNYAINKEHPNFIFNESVQEMNIGHKRSLTSVYAQIEEDGYDVNQLKKKINEIFIKTIITGYPILSASYLSQHPENFSNDMCFQILGFDIMIDHKLTPYLIQINYTPSFSTDTPLDKHIKKNLIYDTLQLINIDDKWKKEMKQKRDKEIHERMVTGKRKKYSTEERKSMMIEESKKRNIFEDSHLGGFKKIFLLHQEQMNQYQKYYQYAFQVYQQNSNSHFQSFTPVIQFPFYKHYFSNENKSIVKFKKNNIEMDQIKTADINLVERRKKYVGLSQGRRIESAKQRQYKVKKNTKKDRMEEKKSEKNEDEGRKEFEFQGFGENESIFRNKKIEEFIIMKKRKSEGKLRQNEKIVRQI